MGYVTMNRRREGGVNMMGYVVNIRGKEERPRRNEENALKRWTL